MHRRSPIGGRLSCRDQTLDRRRLGDARPGRKPRGNRTSTRYQCFPAHGQAAVGELSSPISDLRRPAGMFLPSRTQEAVAVSDLSGNADVTLMQISPQPGINRISIEIMRAGSDRAERLRYHHRARRNHQGMAGPSIAISKPGPPNVAVGQEIPFTITVSNNGKIETQPLDGSRYLCGSIGICPFRADGGRGRTRTGATPVNVRGS